MDNLEYYLRMWTERQQYLQRASQEAARHTTRRSVWTDAQRETLSSAVLGMVFIVEDQRFGRWRLMSWQSFGSRFEFDDSVEKVSARKRAFEEAKMLVEATGIRPRQASGAVRSGFDLVARLIAAHSETVQEMRAKSKRTYNGDAAIVGEQFHSNSPEGRKRATLLPDPIFPLNPPTFSQDR